jgi:hypothetical protein
VATVMRRVNVLDLASHPAPTNAGPVYAASPIAAAGFGVTGALLAAASSSAATTGGGGGGAAATLGGSAVIESSLSAAAAVAGDTEYARLEAFGMSGLEVRKCWSGPYLSRCCPLDLVP